MHYKDVSVDKSGGNMIDKLNNVQFTGKMKKSEVAKKNELPQQEQKPQQKVIVSHDGAKALRNYAMATIAALGLSAAVPTLTSCEQNPDIDFSHTDDLKVKVDYHPLPLDPETLIVYQDRPVHDTIWQTKTDTITKDSIVYVKIPEYINNTDTVWQTKTDTITKDSIVYVDVPVYLPGDTIRDTITVIKPGDTVYLEPDYKSEAADSLIAHCENLGFKFDGEGNVPVRINAFDQWNATNHDLVFDGKASSEEKMVFIDEAKDYSKDSKNPEIRYNRIEFYPDYGKGLTSHIFKSPVAGVKPTSAAAWIEAAKTCNTNFKNGFIGIARYESDGSLKQIGTYEKSKESDVDFYDNLFTDDGYEDSFSWSEARVTLARPKK